MNDRRRTRARPPQNTAAPIDAALEALRAALRSTAATNNPFLLRQCSKGLTLTQIITFAGDYYHWVVSFPAALAGLVGRAADDSTRGFLAAILSEELGMGVYAQRHSYLLLQVFVAAGVPAELVLKGPRYAQTIALVESMRELYQNSSLPVALGAQLALEHQAVPMVRSLSRGFRGFNLNYKANTYFRVHLGSEPQHAKLMTECLQHYVATMRDAKKVKTGAERMLALIGDFWLRVGRETQGPSTVNAVTSLK